MKIQYACVAGLLFVATSLSNLALADEGKSKTADSDQKIAIEAAKEHLLAAEQLDEAAGHQRKAAQFYKAGKFEDAGWNAYMAYAHELRAQAHIEAAAQLHLSEKRNMSDKASPAEPK